jgi:hypothetical protein
MLLLPISASAQEAAISGTITDATGGVLPGVVVRAVNEATGNSFEAVTDSTGKYLMTVRIGGYRIAAELGGFATVERGGVQVWDRKERRVAAGDERVDRSDDHINRSGRGARVTHCRSGGRADRPTPAGAALRPGSTPMPLP